MIIKLEKASKIYNTTEVKTAALNSVDLTINKGDFVAILGPSGSGKSTMLHIMGLLDSLTKGKMLLLGKDVSKITADEAAELRSRHIGFVFQAFNLLPTLTTLENVMLPSLIAEADEKESEKKARALLIKLGLEDKLSNRPNQLSGGQQQRVAIARALAMDPDFILADEPTGNLDSKSGEEVVHIFEKLNKEGRTIVMVTHDTEVTRHAHRIIYLRDGKIEKEVKK